MAASALGNNQEGSSASAAAAAQKSTANGVSVNSSNNGGNNSSAAAAAVDTSQTASALRHNSGISVLWTAEEQSLLEDLLAKYASDSNIVRYAKISRHLQDKTVRDVALRCRWMTKKENGKRRKEDPNSARKNKDRKEKATDSSSKSSSHLAARPNGPSYAPPMIPMDTDDGISCKAIGGVTGELLEQNAQMFNQISANFSNFQIHDNIDLFCKARDNILTILNEFDEESEGVCDVIKESYITKEDWVKSDLKRYLSEQNSIMSEKTGLSDMPEIMKQMPPLPVKVNEELVNSILPRQSHQMKS